MSRRKPHVVFMPKMWHHPKTAEEVAREPLAEEYRALKTSNRKPRTRSLPRKPKPPGSIPAWKLGPLGGNG